MVGWFVHFCVVFAATKGVEVARLNKGVAEVFKIAVAFVGESASRSVEVSNVWHIVAAQGGIAGAPSVVFDDGYDGVVITWHIFCRQDDELIIFAKLRDKVVGSRDDNIAIASIEAGFKMPGASKAIGTVCRHVILF